MPHAGPIQRVPRGEIVAAIQHDLGLRHQRIELIGPRPLRHLDHLDVGIESMQRTASRRRLRLPDPVGRVQHLALQVGQVDPIRIDQGQASDASAGQVKRGG